MPYTITRYQLTADPDAKFPLTLLDNTIDSTTTSLNLLGQGVRNYGTGVADDLVWLLENFAGTGTPGNPIVGQLWWDTANQLLKVYRGSGVWRGVAYDRAATAPTSPQPGDLWYNSSNNIMNYFNGSVWIQLSNGNTGAVPVTNNGHNILELIANGEIMVIISNATFTPSPAIPGFPTVYRGMTMTNINSATYVGPATFD